MGRANGDRAENAPVHLAFGTSGGVGSALCRRLAASGATLALASRPSARLDDLARDVDAPKWELDAGAPVRVEAVASEVVERLGRVDGGLGSLRTRG